MIPDKLGQHAMWIAGDVIGLHCEGSLVLSDVIQLREVLDARYRVYKHCFILADLRRCSGIDAEARKYMAEWSRIRPTGELSTVFYGASFAMRAITTLMLNAIKLLVKQQGEVVFVKDEAEARRWVDVRRALNSPGGAHGG